MLPLLGICKVRNKIKRKRNEIKLKKPAIQKKQNIETKQNQFRVDKNVCRFFFLHINIHCKNKMCCKYIIVNCIYRPTIRQFPITFFFRIGLISYYLKSSVQ